MKQQDKVPCYRCQQMTKPLKDNLRPVEVSRNSEGGYELYFAILCKRCRTWVDRNKPKLKFVK